MPHSEPPDYEVDVLIVGAGPVGLFLANALGARSLKVLLVEERAALIDYPRGVGMDDECLRALQSIGVIEDVLPHTTPQQIMRFVNGKGRVFASIDPKTDEFGWPRRNAFIQPAIDRVLADALARFPGVELLLGYGAGTFEQDDNGVSAVLTAHSGDVRRVQARYLVGADGGRSAVRKTLSIPFEGLTDANRWIVVDIADDPIGIPNAYLVADPKRPYASIALPHGIRRLEFMLFSGEGESGEVPRDILNQMLAQVIPEPNRINLIRSRIYTHNGRLARQFRERRMLIAGDAAHLMPVWQGQGYNSGVRDAFNLGWKIALVSQGRCGDALLDTYGLERREHAKAMIDLSETAGKVFAMRNGVAVWARDAFTFVANFLPTVRRYFLEMRFKPMPRYKEGALYYGSKGFDKNSPVGRMFIQPHVAMAAGAPVLLDEAIGEGFALLSWGLDPTKWLDSDSRRILERLGVRLFTVVPMTQVGYENSLASDSEILGDCTRRLKQWFDAQNGSIVLLRPDRFVALLCRPQQLDEQVHALGARLFVLPGAAAARNDISQEQQLADANAA